MNWAYKKDIHREMSGARFEVLLVNRCGMVNLIRFLTFNYRIIILELNVNICGSSAEFFCWALDFSNDILEYASYSIHRRKTELRKLVVLCQTSATTMISSAINC